MMVRVGRYDPGANDSKDVHLAFFTAMPTSRLLTLLAGDDPHKKKDPRMSIRGATQKNTE
jgi:hypothetical protein